MEINGQYQKLMLVLLLDGSGEQKKNTPKSITDLGNMYFNSVGHNAPLLLNVPPNTDGTVDDQILERLAEFGQNINETFDENLAAGADVKIGASSVRGNDITYKPGNVIDGDDSTYWTVDDQGQSGTLLIDLGSTKSLMLYQLKKQFNLAKVSMNIKLNIEMVTMVNGKQWMKVRLLVQKD